MGPLDVFGDIWQLDCAVVLLAGVDEEQFEEQKEECLRMCHMLLGSARRRIGSAVDERTAQRRCRPLGRLEPAGRLVG